MKAKMEKEIINDIKMKILLPFEYFPHADGLGITREGIVRIRQLLNMYSTKKRENKELSKKIERISSELAIGKRQYEQLVDELNKSFISKDELRAEIRKLEPELKLENFRDGASIQIKLLCRLLKGEYHEQ